MDHIFVYKAGTLLEIPKQIPDTCQECGANCSKTERAICLSEIDGGRS